MILSRRAFIEWAHTFSVGTQSFIALYLLVHGLVKIILVLLLVKKKLRAYPWAICVFALFAAYQIYRATLYPSVALFGLIVLDAAIIFFIYLEYRSVTRAAART